jgi:hypothetical protein
MTDTVKVLLHGQELHPDDVIVMIHIDDTRELVKADSREGNPIDPHYKFLRKWCKTDPGGYNGASYDWPTLKESVEFVVNKENKK